MSYVAWITPYRDGIPRRVDILADDIDHARELAADMAACMFPRQSLAICVRGEQ